MLASSALAVSISPGVTAGMQISRCTGRLHSLIKASLVPNLAASFFNRNPRGNEQTDIGLEFIVDHQVIGIECLLFHRISKVIKFSLIVKNMKSIHLISSFEEGVFREITWPFYKDLLRFFNSCNPYRHFLRKLNKTILLHPVAERVSKVRACPNNPLIDCFLPDISLI